MKKSVGFVLALNSTYLALHMHAQNVYARSIYDPLPLPLKEIFYGVAFCTPAWHLPPRIREIWTLRHGADERVGGVF